MRLNSSKIPNQYDPKVQEEKLLRRACAALMSQVRDVSDEMKLHQFKKFYPDVYKEIYAKKFRNIGKKDDRKPLKDDGDRSSKAAILALSSIEGALMAKTTGLHRLGQKITTINRPQLVQHTMTSK